jgi:hypothetical protein
MTLFLVAHSKAIKYVTIAYRQSVLMRVFVRRKLQILLAACMTVFCRMANSLTVSGRMSSTIVRDEQARQCTKLKRRSPQATTEELMAEMVKMYINRVT